MNKTLSALALALGTMAFSVGAESNSSIEGSSDAVVAPRDAASGLATGKRQHMSGGSGAGGGAAQASYAATGMATSGSGDETGTPDAAASGVKSPRDAASGLATGKRQHMPASAGGDDYGDGVTSTKAQDHNSTRSNKTASVAGEGPSSGDERVAPRDAASGLATGKRQHKPMTVTTDGVDSEGSDSKAQDHNSSRSNKSNSKAPEPAEYNAKQGKTGSAK